MVKVTELHYDNTNTYVIATDRGTLMFDTGWAGTFPKLCKELGQKGLRLQDVDYLLISHYHPDHCGIAQNIAEQGVTLIAMESQKGYLHEADKVFAKENRGDFLPIREEAVKWLAFSESADFLKTLGLNGQILATPGHSEDSVSLVLHQEAAFVGDLYPLYELEVQEEIQVKDSWQQILALNPKNIYYGHAKTAILEQEKIATKVCPPKTVGVHDMSQPTEQKHKELYQTVKRIMQYIDKGWSLDRIETKLKVEHELVSDVCRMYLTHQNVGVQGILDRIEIKGK